VRPDAPSAFYTPPAELPTGPPGTIIRQEDVAGLPADRQAWRVLSTSTAPDGSPIAVSGVVVAPTSEPPADGWPVVAWAHGTTGVASRCAPSLEAGAGIHLVPELDALLAGGAVVAITDYPGLGTPGPHPYLVGESEGRAVLDSIHAARALLGSDTSATAAVFGHSQGGHSAVFADAIAGTYAPDIDLVGVAAMAPPTDLGELLELDSSEPAGIVVTALAVDSWSHWFPDADLDTIVHPVARPLVADVASECIETTEQSLPVIPDVLGLEATFLSQDPAQAPGWSQHLADNSPQAVSTSVPLLVAQGLADTLVRPAITESFVQARCADGASIALHTYAGVGHFEVRTTSAPLVAGWLLDRVHGEPAPTGCTTTAD
jgi:alpha-beta hydrolase superfamily lysophospholipase